MPNWCEGNIRLRGKRNAILEFLKNEIQVVGYKKDDILDTVTLQPIIDDEYDEITVKFPNEADVALLASMYISGTHRNFIEESEFYVYLPDDDEIHTVCIDGFKAAWGVDARPYLDKARKYGVDIRIVGFEKGMQFMQDIEIMNGVIKKNEEIQFDDWDWECLMPQMGG